MTNRSVIKSAAAIFAAASLGFAGMIPLAASADPNSSDSSQPGGPVDSEQGSVENAEANSALEGVEPGESQAAPEKSELKGPESAPAKYTFGTDLDPTVNCTGDCAKAPQTVESDGKTYELVWNDEFDTPLLDESKWAMSQTPENGRFCYSNIQGEDPTTSNLYNYKGALTVQALPRGYNGYNGCNDRKPVWHAYSGSIETKDKASWKYGRFEARVRTASGDGMWPALWMMPDYNPYGWPKDGEIDWIENIGVSNYEGHGRMFTTVQLNAPGTNKKAWQAKPALVRDFDLGADFHTYAMEWDPGVMKFYFDGEYYGKIENWENKWHQEDGAMRTETPPGPFDKNFFFKLNLAVNGGWGGVPENKIGWDQNKFQVDFVRVYQTKEQQALENRKYVKFDTMSGAEWPEQLDVEKDQVIEAKNLPVPSRKGYTFAGWYLDQKRTKPVPAQLLVSEDTQLFAQWKESTSEAELVTINFDSRGGDKQQSKRVERDSAVRLPVPKRDGYVFVGWFENENDEQPVTEPYRPTRDITLFAKWTEIGADHQAVTITYDTMSSLKAPAARKVLPGQLIWLPKLERPGFEFQGWYLDRAYQHPAISGDVKRFSTDKDVVLFAKWAKKPANTPPSGDITRVSGDNRFQTAVKLSRSTYGETATTVYLANAMDYPDALVAGAVAGNDHASLLLTEPTRLAADVKAEIARLKPDYVVAIGGNAAVSQQVLKAAADASGPGTIIDRYAGPNRFDTAAVTALRKFVKPHTVYVAAGMNYPDALAASAAAGAKASPVLLTLDSELPAQTRKALQQLNPARIVIVGGEGAVNANVARSISAAVPGATVDRIGGADRYQTAQFVAEDAFGANVPVVYVAAGRDFPDALAAAGVAGTRGGPVLLTLQNEAPASLLKAFEGLGPKHAVVVGGPAVVSDAVKAQLAKHAGLRNK